MKTTKEVTREEIIEVARPILESFFDDKLDSNTWENIEPNISEIEYKPYPGFWPWTSGGLQATAYQYVSFLVSSGYYNAQTKIGKQIDVFDNEAHTQATEQIGERTEANEDRYFEVVDEWLSDVTVDIDIRVKFYEPHNYGNPSPGNTVIQVDALIECGPEKIMSEGVIITDIHVDLESKLKSAIAEQVKFLNDNI